MKVVDLKQHKDDGRLEEISKDLDLLKKITKEGRLGKMLLVFEEQMEEEDEFGATIAKHTIMHDEGKGPEAMIGFTYTILWYLTMQMTGLERVGDE